MISYADDSFLTYGLNIEDAALEASVRFTALQDWFSENRLILNNQKTQALIFKTKNSVETIIDDIMLGDFKVPINSDAKILGIHLDVGLNWHAHIAQLNLIALRTSRKYISYETLTMVYRVFVTQKKNISPMKLLLWCIEYSSRKKKTE
ncbi:hypothetical protein QE152_g10977 [Popillia japonica]|uniref:Reverse transcriptase domain-containing protein n=1 Tax=Popillia japonica TaxID=7064 RepID=A0AAW1LTM1_POPJA